jgi:hypothetical protein
VIFVTVGEHDRHDVLDPVPDPGEVGEDDVDPGLGLLGEQHPAVDDEQLAGVLEDGHIATDLTQSAQAHHPQAVPGQCGRRTEFGVRMTHSSSLKRRSDAASAAERPTMRKGNRRQRGLISVLRRHACAERLRTRRVVQTAATKVRIGVRAVYLTPV